MKRDDSQRAKFWSQDQVSSEILMFELCLNNLNEWLFYLSLFDITIKIKKGKGKGTSRWEDTNSKMNN